MSATTSRALFFSLATLTIAWPAMVRASRPLEVEVNDADIDAGALEASLERELNVEVHIVPPGRTALLRIEPLDAERVQVEFRRAEGRSLRRIIALPRGTTLEVEGIALLAANLIRNEAADLLATFSPASPPEEEVSVPALENELPPPVDAPASVVEDPVRALVTPASTDDPCVARGRLTVGADLLPYVGSSSFPRERRAVRVFSLNVFGGIARGLQGVEVGGFLNIYSEFACGYQMGGAINLVLGPMKGIQWSPYNFARTLVGGQLGVFNVTRKLEGAQIGVANLVLGDVDGTQGGVVNVARDVRGAQVGIINVARSTDASIGLFSFLLRGRTHLDAWGTEAGIVAAGAVHGSSVVHNVYGVGFRSGPRGEGLALLLGIGVRLVDFTRLSIDLDGIAAWLFPPGLGDPPSSLYQFRVPFTVRFTRGFGVFLGPSYQFLYTRDELEGGPLRSLTSTVRERDRHRTLAWPGLTLGIRVFP